MRLKVLENGHSLAYKLKFRVMGIVSGIKVPDVVKMLSYKPAFFGKAFSLVVDSILRKSPVWSHGECELFAAFVSNRNQCPF